MLTAGAATGELTPLARPRPAARGRPRLPPRGAAAGGRRAAGARRAARGASGGHADGRSPALRRRDGARARGSPRRRRAACAAMRAAIARALPAFADAVHAARPWAGLRPCSPDGLPYVGRVPRYPNAVVATGHCMLGLSLAPITAGIAGALVEGQAPPLDVGLLDPARFDRPGRRRTVTAPWWQTALAVPGVPALASPTPTATGSATCPASPSRLDYLAELGRRRDLALAVLPLADGRLRLRRRPTTATSTRCSARSTTSTRLVDEAHARGLRVIARLRPQPHVRRAPVVRRGASLARTSPRRDWYVWRDAKPDGSPPNNWVELLRRLDVGVGRGDGAVLPAPRSSASSPTSTGATPRCGPRCTTSSRFWLDRGVDGFRIDVLWLPGQARRLRRQPAGADRWPRTSTPWTRYDSPAFEDLPETHEIVREMRAVSDEYDDRVLIGEIYLPLARLVTYYGDGARRRPPAVQLLAGDDGRLGRGHDPPPGRRVRGGAAGRAPGRTGCSATTTCRASPRARARRPGWRRCCC